MGNDSFKEKRRALLPPNPHLNVGYSGYFHKISSFPEGMERHRCTIIGHSPDYKTYILRDDTDRDRVYMEIPHIYVSGLSKPYEWDDYFKVGTIVKTTAFGNVPESSEILEIRHEEPELLVDLKSLKTGFVVYGVSPRSFYFDVDFYRDW